MNLEITEQNVCRLLREAVAEGNIKAYYQPKYDALNSRLVGAEALARWIPADGIVISPDMFVPPLEKTGGITELDWYILEQVCAMVKSQLDNGVTAVPVSVNFSRMHTLENDFIQKLCGTVDRYGIPHKLIEAEITESALADGGESLIDFVRKIREAGFSVAIDDFGSGLSSLNFVKDVPADIIKIDKSLLSSNCEDEKERIVLESIFGFANRLDLVTVAEGVETEQQLGFLRTCDCRSIQGYLFSKPLPEQEYMKLCAETNTQAEVEAGDILFSQAPASTTNLLMQAVFTRYPLIIMCNLTRNSYYMMCYSNFTTTECAASGSFDELIEMGASTMHPEDRHLFTDAFKRENLLDAFAKGETSVTVHARQMGDDGIYRMVETTDYLVKSPHVDDIIVINLSRPLE